MKGKIYKVCFDGGNEAVFECTDIYFLLEFLVNNADLYTDITSITEDEEWS